MFKHRSFLRFTCRHIWRATLLLSTLPASAVFANENKQNLFLGSSIFFSQGEAHEFDRQLPGVSADINLRAWQKWRNLATRAEHFPAALIKQYRENNIVLIAGGTASVIFEDETQREKFLDWATVDAKGELVPHDYIVPGAHRASMANPNYRQYLIDLFKLQIDAGVDGLFIDEVNAGAYSGGQKWRFNGNEGFDKYFLADFNRYLLGKYSHFSKEEWISRFRMSADNYPRKEYEPADLENNFNYRRYLARHGWSEAPLNTDNPLLEEWGFLVPNRTFPSVRNFREQAMLRYWKEIVDSLKAYAKLKYQKDLLITSNGIFPYVDFNSVGLYEYNFDDFQRFDGSGFYLQGKQADYVPTKNGKLNGSVSLQPIFKNLYDYNQQVAGDVPLVLFIDWPTEMMRNYNGFSKQQREDYWSLYVADAYAQGLRFAFHLKTSIPGDPSASDKDMLTFFKSHAKFYEHYDQYCGNTKPVSSDSRVNHKNIDSSLRSNKDKTQHCLHLVNHNYRNSINEKQHLEIKINQIGKIQNAFLISPDMEKLNKQEKLDSADKIALDYSQQGETVSLKVKRLLYSAIIVMQTE